jgi:FG-GAP repeat
MVARIRSARLLAFSLGLVVVSAWLVSPAGASGAQRAPRGCLGPATHARASSSALGPSKSTVGPKADFNGDGNGDLAVGVPYEDLGSVSNAGGVNVIYGTFCYGLMATGNQFWSQNSAGVQGVAETNDHVGWVTAAGDFNGDGFSDLAVGAPFEGVDAQADAGAINVLYGSTTGLTSAGNQVFDQDSTGVQGSAEPGDEFGFAVSTGDFNADGTADLAVGVPGEGDGGLTNEGAINVLYGSASGLTATGNQLIRGAKAGDRFGSAMAAANFDAVAGTDLAVGAPDATNAGKANAGEVVWMLGAATGLVGFHSTVDAGPQDGAHCGASLTSLNWDNPAAGFADVMAGCPNAMVGGLPDAGEVELHIGSASGLSDGIVDIPSPHGQAGAEFGSALAGADVGRDGGGGGDDLVVGEPLFDVGGLSDAGRVDVLYVVSGQIVPQVIQQGLNGTPGQAEAGDIFGASVTTGAFDSPDRPGREDIAVGVPGEGVGSITEGGGIDVLYGWPAGLGHYPLEGQFWSQNSTGIVGTAEPEDFFGDSVSGRTD